MYSILKKAVLISILSITIPSSSQCVQILSNTLCGPQCLLMICKHNKINANLDDICRLSGYNTKTGTTFLGLSQAAKAMGLQVSGIRADMDDLCGLNDYCIAFINDSHFVVIQGCDQDSISVVSPPSKPHKESKTIFLKSWGGEALVFSKDIPSGKPKDNKSPKSPLQFKHTQHNFGLVEEGATVSHVFEFTNTGNDTLTLAVRSSCGCTAALLSDNIIPPKKSGKINVDYKTAGKGKGNNKESIYIRTNDEYQPLISLTIQAIVCGSVSVTPEKIWLGDVAPSITIPREIEVIDSGDKSLKILGIQSSEGISTSILPQKKNGSVPIYPIRISIATCNNSGHFEKFISIKTNNIKRPEIVVNISGNVAGMIQAMPQNLFFGEVETDKTITREVNLVSISNIDINNIYVKNNSTHVSSKIEQSKKSSLKLIITLDTSGNDSIIRDNLKIYARNVRDALLQIPIYATVKRN